MLWKKESKTSDALYVDILAPSLHHWESKVNDLLRTIDQKPHPTKSDEIALQKRNEGNEKFCEHKWLDAMELYGDSLRFAEPKSVHVSLAYANRAACFLNLKMYENCLKDIELAKETEYPEHLMPKLDERKKNCMQQMQEDPQTEHELNFVPNDQFPMLANVAEVRKNENGGYSIVAKTDIDVGQIIGIEEPFQKHVIGNFGSTCCTCLKEYGNLVACTKCARAMFCPDCKDDDWLHEYECGLNFGENDSDLNRAAKETIRYALQTIKAFSSVDNFMAFVEQYHKNPVQRPANLLDERSKYQLFFIKTNNRRIEIDAKTQCALYCGFKTLLRIPQINQMFQSEKHQRFLMHLIAHQFSWRRITSASSIRIAVGMEKYFTNSCDPNVADCIYDGKMIFYSVKPIQQGEELNLSHIPMDIVVDGSTEERQNKLSELGYEKCECPRCNGRMASPEQYQQMFNDPAFKSSVHNFMLLMTNKANKVNASKTLDDCVKFLRKYGRMDFCDVMGSVTKIFEIFYRASLTKELDHPLARAELLKIFDE